MKTGSSRDMATVHIPPVEVSFTPERGAVTKWRVEVGSAFPRALHTRGNLLAISLTVKGLTHGPMVAFTKAPLKTVNCTERELSAINTSKYGQAISTTKPRLVLNSNSIYKLVKIICTSG